LARGSSRADTDKFERRGDILEKFKYERYVLGLAVPCLKTIFGEHQIDENQRDRPDAAIVIPDPKGQSIGTKIGIEITTIDPPHALEYINEKKRLEAHDAKRIEAHIRGELLPAEVAKRATIALTKTYISAGVKAKAEKYKAYHEAGSFDQLVLIASTELLLGPSDLIRYHSQWSNYLLSKEKYPFDHVILVIENTKSCMRIYEKQRPRTIKPDDDIAPTVEYMRTGFIPIGRQNLGANNTPPAIPIRQKKR